MCGRFVLSSGKQAVVRHFELEWEDAPELTARYNIAPSQLLAVVRARTGAEGGPRGEAAPEKSAAREMVLLRWGLVPAWSKEPRPGPINARAETLAAKPTFRANLQRRRCLIPADGFYEWTAASAPGARAAAPAGPAAAPAGKRPYFFRARGGELLAFAGLWDEWRGADGEILATCAIITTAANSVVAPLHDRMPAILPPADYARWLDPAQRDAVALSALLRPWPSELMDSYAVSTWVNRPQNDSPACLAPAAV